MAFDFYQNTPDEDLLYYGLDELVWDRINAERLRRGLPSLSALGIERPQADTTQTQSASGGTVLGDSFQFSEVTALTNSQKNQIGDLENRRAQITRRLTLLQNAQLDNQRLLTRRQTELAGIQDPAAREQLQRQILDLQTVIDSESQQLARSNQQLDTISTEITQSLRTAFAGSPTLAALPGGASLTSLVPSVPAALRELDTLPIELPVNAAEVLKQDPATVKIPGLDQSQITGLLGSAAKAAESNSAGLSAGIGKFALSPEQLESQGLLKPGTTKSFLSDPVVPTAQDIAESQEINAKGGSTTPETVANNRRLNAVLSSPFSWTGKNGVNNLAGFTSNESLQSLSQQNIMNKGLTDLKSLGVVKGNESPEQLAALVQSSAKFGADNVKAWSEGLAAPDITSSINNVAKNAEQAVNLVNTQIPNLGSVPAAVEGKTATVNRQNVDAGFAVILGDPKISLPNFGAAGAGIDSSLYANTQNDDLTYTGDDPVVWDRINAERIRRGLPGLESEGSPRPSE